MKKRSHLFVTREIIEQVPQNKRKWLLLGSILPDILVHTYIKKHTWKSSFDNTVNRIQKLEEKQIFFPETRICTSLCGGFLHICA